MPVPTWRLAAAAAALAVVLLGVPGADAGLAAGLNLALLVAAAADLAATVSPRALRVERE
ncbi:MAG: polysaccharide biosynthesis protein, partial [Euzebyaceae bacterium]|nr:polysaccharide biosynthesis protein [Euzebyaceae bacterium]